MVKVRGARAGEAAVESLHPRARQQPVPRKNREEQRGVRLEERRQNDTRFMFYDLFGGLSSVTSTFSTSTVFELDFEWNLARTLSMAGERGALLSVAD